MKKYTVSVRPKHRTSLHIDIASVEKAFPVILEAKNKDQVKDMAESIIRDLGTHPEGFVITIEIGC
jgi:hypothetical protein